MSDVDTCLRCGFACRHVEASGIWSCPNCGPAKDEGNNTVSYAFWLGCETCQLRGRQPDEARLGNANPAARVFGVAPVTR